MTWHSSWPEGAKSVKGNKLFGQENTTYIENTNNIDHYWNASEGANDGHHKHVQMTMTGTSAVPADAVLANSMDGAFFVKAKTDKESIGNQDAQPFFINNKAVGTRGDTAVMQLLGIRAMGHFSLSGTTITTQYVYNVVPSDPGPCGIARSTLGGFTVTFENALPTANYFVLGGAMNSVANDASQLLFGVNSTNAATTTVKSDTFFKFNILDTGFNRKDPKQCWFVVFGG